MQGGGEASLAFIGVADLTLLLPASPTNFLSKSDINFEQIDLSVRTASKLQCRNKERKPTKCACRGQCLNKRCHCKKDRFKYDSGCACNSGKSCANRHT